MACSIHGSGTAERLSSPVSAGTTSLAAVAPARLQRPDRSLARDTWRRFRRHRLAAAGLVIYAALVLATLVGPLVWRVGINDIDLGAQLTFSSGHPLGTDDLGRDVLARLLS